MSNVLVFALWYWKLDAGGPYARASRDSHDCGAFLFPQMSMPNQKSWTPYFIDYVFWHSIPARHSHRPTSHPLAGGPKC